MSNNTHPAYKRICLFSDGTWNSDERDSITSIVTMSAAVREEDDDGVQQVVFYDPGVGTANPLDAFLGGAFGDGIDRNIKQLYSFLALNYSPGDEVYLFGYSRGAFTVRSLAGMVHEVGLVKRPFMKHVHEAYTIYRDEDPTSSRAVQFRQEFCRDVPIKLIACIDTVGALGIPSDYLQTPMGPPRSRYQFHDTKLGPLVEHGIHACSIDEDKGAFDCTPMEQNEAVEGQVTERFFWGKHGEIGSSNANADAADTVCRFVIDEMRTREIPLVWDMSLLPEHGNVSDTSRGVKEDNLIDKIVKVFTGTAVREIKDVSCLHSSAVERYNAVQAWRPKALEHLKTQIEKLA